MLRSIYQRFGRPFCLVALLCWPVLLYGAKEAFDSNSNNVVDWLPDNFDETARLVWFAERFGSDEVLVASWPGCRLDDPRLDQFAEQLTQPVAVPSSDQPVPLFRHVFTGRETLEGLQGPPLDLSRRQAIHRMQGWLVGPDGATTCAVALVSFDGFHHREEALQWVRATAADCGIASGDLHLGGPTADSVAIDQASRQWMFELTGLSCLWGLIVASWCLRSARLVAAVFTTASFGWSVSLAVLHFSGGHMDAVLMMMPALVFVLGISGAVHLTGYYRSALLKMDDGWDAAVWAVRQGWLPCVMASLTTAIGLGSLMLSEVTPIAKFGAYAAIGVLVVMVCLLAMWPVLVGWWMSPAAIRRLQKRMRTPSTKPKSAWWLPCYRISTGRPFVVLGMLALLLPVLGFGVSRIETSVHLDDLFPRSSQIIQDYEWLQGNIGPLVPVEVVLRFKPAEAKNSTEVMQRVALVETMRRRIDGMPKTNGTTAATTFMVDVPRGGGIRQITRRAVIAGQLKKDRAQLEAMKYLYRDENEELWRISTRVPALEGMDYAAFLAGLEHEVNGLLEQQADSTSGVSAIVSGGVPMISMAQQQLLRDLIQSFLTAFVLIAIVMTVLIRNPAAGLLSMIPNVFPVLVVFGLMGLAGSAIDIGAMMTASAALGIAVDDTLHFLVWFRRGHTRSSSRSDAIRYAFEHCATPMLQTSLICGLGLLAFVLSPFTPISRFAWLMASLLTLALVADLLLLPALLASRWGRYFEPARAEAATDIPAAARTRWRFPAKVRR